MKGRGKPRVVRRFVKPHINMAATAYTEMVNFAEIQLYEPPITIGLPLEVLAKCLDDWDALKLPQLSSNNIPLERLIRISFMHACCNSRLNAYHTLCFNC